MDNDELQYREDVFALEREAKREADILRLAIEHESTPATLEQGHLSHRWKRRDGNVYRAAAAPWWNFEADPGWTGNTIRYRIMNIGGASTLQVIGAIQAPLPAQARARVGILPAGFRPAQNYSIAGTVMSGLTYGWALWELAPNGEVWTVWGVGSSGVTSTGSINAIVPLD
ncbi:MAG TPA: hypothetical protein VHT52_22555 [Stellaceae bacterium]|nr:hypothetical protein [Stellaceae bacterium]